MKQSKSARPKNFKIRRPSKTPCTEGHGHIPYLSRAHEKFDKTSKLAKAYEVALDTRKFEIELYWKRATYFWAIAAVVLGAIGLVVANSIKDGRLDTYPILFMIETLSCVGFIVTKAWQYVNLGGKFWQQNWELHVDILEQEVMFPLFRTVVAECPAGTEVKAEASSGEQTQQSATQAKDKNPNLAPVFSPSKVNHYLGRFLNTIFIVVGLLTFMLIISKAGILASFAATLGIHDIRKFITDSSIWLIPLAALIPLVYTCAFWINMAGKARTTTLEKHLLNVTQRNIRIHEKIGLPDTKPPGLKKGWEQVKAEINPFLRRTKQPVAQKQHAVNQSTTSSPVRAMADETV